MTIGCKLTVNKCLEHYLWRLSQRRWQIANGNVPFGIANVDRRPVRLIWLMVFRKQKLSSGSSNANERDNPTTEMDRTLIDTCVGINLCIVIINLL